MSGCYQAGLIGEICHVDMRKNKNGLLLWIEGVASRICASVIWNTCGRQKTEDRRRNEVKSERGRDRADLARRDGLIGFVDMARLLSCNTKVLQYKGPL